jgi:pimeloyl-ACP methyl ester carboxylesterase
VTTAEMSPLASASAYRRRVCERSMTTVHSDIGRLHFEWMSNPRRHALVVLNTITGDTRSWPGLYQPLAQRLAVLSVDVRNRGGSSFTARSATIQEQVDDIARLVGAAGVTQPIWVGNSASTLLAYRVAAALPTTALILLAPLFSFGMLRKVGLVRKMLLGSLADDSLRDFHRLLTFLTYSGQYLDNNPSVIPVGLTRLRALYTAETLRVACEQTFFPEADDSAMLKEVSCPVLMVRPEREELMSEESLVSVAASFAHPVMRVVPSGHGLLEEAPEATFAVIAAFMKELERQWRAGGRVGC